MEEAYVERLSVPFRWWALAVMFWATLLVAFLVAVPTLVATGIVAVLMVATAAFFRIWGSAEVAVVDGVFHAGRARIPVHLLADPTSLSEDEARRAVGVDADARAYLLLRPYVGRAVRVTVVDPADPTPYWVVASRHPDALASCLTAAVRGSVIGQTERPTETEG
jgi:hypothetical protein